MAHVWLDPDGVANRLGVCRKTAVKLMYEMPHTTIGGPTRKMIRVAETALDNWMAERGVGRITSEPSARSAPARKRVPRRGET